MAKVLTHMCMSLDGFVAQPDDNPAELFDWYWSGDVVVPSAQESMSFSVDAASALMLQELTSGCGALIAGRRLTGIRYFGELVSGHVMLEDPVVVEGTRALHLRYPVRAQNRHAASSAFT
jgi:hypothetical protein